MVFKPKVTLKIKKQQRTNLQSVFGYPLVKKIIFQNYGFNLIGK